MTNNTVASGFSEAEASVALAVQCHGNYQSLFDMLRLKTELGSVFDEGEPRQGKHNLFRLKANFSRTKLARGPKRR